MKGIIGKKIGMTQMFAEDGSVVPITVVKAGPCPVIQKKTLEKEGYEALQIALLPKKKERVNKPLLGHFAKSGKGTYYVLKEIRTGGATELEIGHEITVDIFKPGEFVDAIGTSKGRGFSGVIKRHGFTGAPGAHGTHEYFRHGGSIGANSTPAHVLKGKRMPGQYGNRQVTAQNLEIMDVRPEENLLLIKGALPGWKNGIVIVREAKKKGSAP